jgi:uncharacterized protein YqhQ
MERSRVATENFTTPVMRGVVTLFQALILGIQALNFSAKQSLEEEDEEDEFGTGTLVLTIASAIVLSIARCLSICHCFSHNVLKNALPLVETSSILFNLIDGVLRVMIFLGYLIGNFSESRIYVAYLNITEPNIKQFIPMSTAKS